MRGSVSKNFYTNVERRGNNILFRGFEKGIRVSKKIPFKPSLFVTSKNQDSEWRSFIGNLPVEPMKFETMSEASDFVSQYKDVSGFNVYGTTNFVTQFLQERYPKQLTPDLSKIHIFFYDIETDSENGYADIDLADKEIISISFKSSLHDTYHILSLKDYDKTKSITGIDPSNIFHIKCANETRLLRTFIEQWCNVYPDVVSGWNIDFYDNRYLINRLKRLFGDAAAKKLSPWGNIKERIVSEYGKDRVLYEISGIATIDYLDAFKKFGYKYGTQESYKLDHIAHTVLGEKKLSYEEYGNLNNLYKENPQLFIDYSLKDTYLVQRIDEETSLISLVLSVAYKGGVNYKDAFGTVGIWESIMYREMMLNKKVPPLKSGPGNKEELLGGYVKLPTPGLYEWVVTLDLASLYPHLMMQYNISPETYIQGKQEDVSIEDALSGSYVNPDKTVSVCPNGACFTNNFRGLLPSIIDGYYAERDVIKKEMIQVEKDLQEIDRILKERGVKV